MRIVQRYPLDYFATSTFDAGEEKVVWHFKALNTEYTQEYLYRNLSPDIVRIRSGIRGAKNCALYTFMLSAVAAILLGNFNKRLKLVTCFCLIVASLVLFMLDFFKQEFIYFHDKDGKYNFFFNSDRNPELADFILEKIKACDVS